MANIDNNNKTNSNSTDNTTYDDHQDTIIGKLTTVIHNFFRKKPHNREQFLNYLNTAENNHILTNESKNMIEGVLRVSDTQVRDIMIPRSQMVVIELSSSLEDLLPKVVESGHSRFPVIGENRDEVVGTILSKDLLPYILKTEEKVKLKDLIRPAMVIPESKRLNVLLREFKIKRQHMAIIADEYGGISGLVTIEDVLEQIVGEIEDEFDPEEEKYIIHLKNNIFHVQALTPIAEFNDYFKTDFSDEEFDTIGGFVMSNFGYLPKKNEVTIINNFRIKILNADNRRIKLLKITQQSNKHKNNNKEKQPEAE